MITDRFKGAQYMKLLQALPLHVVGAGGIGSPFMFTVTRTNPDAIYMNEFDTVEGHNIGGQTYGKEHVDMTKFDAISKVVKAFADYEKLTNFGKFTEGSEVFPVMAMCVDNNPTRKLAFWKWYEDAVENNWEWKVEVDGVELIIPYVMFDGRLSFENYDVYCVTKHSAEYHGANRIPDKVKIVAAGCTTVANPEVGFLTGNRMVTYYRNFLTNVINLNQGFPASKFMPYRFNEDLGTGDINVWKCPTQQLSTTNEAALSLFGL